MAQSWEQIATAKRDAVNALIPESWRISNPPSREQQPDITGDYVQQLLNPEEVAITESDATDIASKIASRQWRSVAVTKAFCHRAALVHQLTNCLLEIFFDAGIRQAEQLDQYQDANGTTLGPLHGVPVSLKDQVHVPGVETTMGYVGWIGTFQGEKGTGKEKVFESVLAKDLRQSGAVLYCKTSVPHTLMLAETVNNIMGSCWNAKNRLLSSGGSSGGEGVLLAAHGSPLGFGTDIAGSIRIPSAVNGIYGLRPSGGRMPYEGMSNSSDGQNTILSTVGPMATSLASIVLATKASLSREPWLHDPLVHEIPWRDDHYAAVRSTAQGLGPGKLSFGVIRSDGIMTPHPPVRRAVEETIKALERLGHQVIEWRHSTESHGKLLNTAFTTFSYDGGLDAIKTFELSGEPLSPQLSTVFSQLRPEQTATQIAANNRHKRELQKEYLEYWNSTREKTRTGRPVDAIICPVAPQAASIPEQRPYIGYTAWVNVLDYSSVVVPVIHCDKAIDKVDGAFKSQNDADEQTQSLYDPELFHGTPVGLQIVGRRLQEEKTIALAEVVDEAIKLSQSKAA